MTRPTPSANAINRHAAHDKRGKTPRPLDPLDWFVEEAFAVRGLLDWLRPTGVALDPCAGMGTIPRVARDWGLECLASDVADRGYDGVTPRVDFLLPGSYPAGAVDWVITNPPYFSGKGPRDFLEPALDVARVGVALLVNLPFLTGQRRHAFHTRSPLAHVLILSRRPSMPPGALLASGEVKQEGGKEDYCWLVYRHGHEGPRTIDFLLPPDKDA